MKTLRANKLKFVPASHEDPSDPVALKKVLATFKDFIKGGEIQMINWTKLVGNKKSGAHYHETMQEIFIVISGKVGLDVDNKEVELKPGDAAFIEPGETHVLWNVGKEESEFLAIGIAKGEGKTILIKEKS